MGMKTLSRSFLTLAVVLFCTEFVRSAFLLSFLPFYAVNELNFTVAWVGLAVSLHYVADTGIKLVAGYLLDRFPLRWLIPVTFLLMLGGLLAVFFSPFAWVMIVGSVLIGIGASPIWLICLGKVKEKQRASQMGMIYTIWMASLGLGPITINLILAQSYGLSFWLLFILLTVGFAVSFSLMKEARLNVLKVSVSEQFGQLGQKLIQLKWLAPGMVLQMMAAGLLLPILPSFASQHLGLNEAEYSLMLLLGGAGAILFLVPMGKLADKWGHKRMLVIGFCCLTAALYLLIWSASMYSTLMLALILGLSYSAVLPAWNAILSYLVPPDQKGTGWGILSGIEGLGIMIGPVIGGWIASRYTDAASVTISAVLLAFIALFYMLLPKNKLVAEDGKYRSGDKVQAG